MVDQTTAKTEIAANLKDIGNRIGVAAATAGRQADGVTLVAVSKTFPAEHIRPALEAGHRTFGENRVQETLDKWPALKDAFPDVSLHLIGPLQTNKVRKVLPIADVIETVDREKLARALAAEMDRIGHRPDCYIQVNTGEEPQKAGVVPNKADTFIRACIDDYGLPVRGLMCIPPFNEESAMHFALLAKIAERNGLPGLSMGMSHDFEVAVQFGATLVRVGTAIFGQRPPFKPSVD